MAHDVIMPALGMAQDEGVILAWLKQPGEAVARGDALLEVETDKAAVEIEAEADGFLSDVTVEAGSAAPVGSRIARIVESAADASTDTQTAPAPDAEPEPAPAPLQAAPSSEQPAPAASGKVLASGKARRLAAERGLDLSGIVAAGAREPLHAADIPDTAPAPVAAPMAGMARRSSLSAQAGGAGVDGLRSRIEALTGAPPASQRIWAGFAAGALRAARGQDWSAKISVAAARLDHGVLSETRHLNPDLAGFSDTAEGGEGTDLRVMDLTGSRITRFEGTGDTAAIRLIVAGGETLDLTLDFDESALPLEAAAIMLADIAARAEEPLRHLL